MLFNAIDDDELNIAYVYTCIHTLTYPNKDCFFTTLDALQSEGIIMKSTPRRYNVVG